MLNIKTNWKHLIVAAAGVTAWAMANLNLFPESLQDEIQLVAGVVAAAALYLAQSPTKK